MTPKFYPPLFSFFDVIFFFWTAANKDALYARFKVVLEAGNPSVRALFVRVQSKISID